MYNLQVFKNQIYAIRTDIFQCMFLATDKERLAWIILNRCVNEWLNELMGKCSNLWWMGEWFLIDWISDKQMIEWLDDFSESMKTKNGKMSLALRPRKFISIAMVFLFVLCNQN